MTTFRVLTGTDFGRANAWARKQPLNPINAAIRKKLMTTTTEMKVITRARFFPGPGGFIAPESTLARSGYQTNNPVINPAEIEYNGIRLLSKTPQSAAEAQKINDAIGA